MIFQKFFPRRPKYDRLGNYFYIRNEPSISYSYAKNQISDCRNSQESSFNCTLVAVHKGADPKLLNLNLLNSLLLYKGGEYETKIQPGKSVFLPSSVVQREFNTLKEEEQQEVLRRVYIDKITLVSIDFRVTFVIHPTNENCIVNPCINC